MKYIRIMDTIFPLNQKTTFEFKYMLSRNNILINVNQGLLVSTFRFPLEVKEGEDPEELTKTIKKSFFEILYTNEWTDFNLYYAQYVQMD